MRRIVMAALAGVAALAAAGGALAQQYVTYGQPTAQDYRYDYAYGHGGAVSAPLIETRHGAYQATGGWADGRGGGCGARCGSGHGQGAYVVLESDGVCGSSCGSGHVRVDPGYGCGSPCGAGHVRVDPGYGYGCGSPCGAGYRAGYGYRETVHWSERRGHWDRYAPYARGGRDRGGRYGYSERHYEGGRGYYERGGYHDDRPPSRPDRRRPPSDCRCDHTLLDDR
jgi:hypothetical protein